MVKNHSLPYYLAIARESVDEFLSCVKMQTASFRIWSWVDKSTSFADNIRSASFLFYCYRLKNKKNLITNSVKLSLQVPLFY